MRRFWCYVVIAMCVVILIAAVGAVSDEATTTIITGPILAKPSEPDKPYTSLIVDATGFALDRSMSPKLRKVDGSEVWGTVKVDYDFLEEHGLVAYASSLEEAKKNGRCGDNPMIVKVLLTTGKPCSDPVIASEDAVLLLEENKKGKFLDKFNVIFIKNPQPAVASNAVE